MAESQTPKTKKLTRDTVPRDSSTVREDTERIVSDHQDKHGCMGNGIAKMETNTSCLLDVQKIQQSVSQKVKFMDIKEEVRDMDSEFPEQFQVSRSEKCISSYEITIADMKEEFSDIEVDFHGHLKYFNSDQCISGQEIMMTDVQGKNKENLSTLSGKESFQNIKNHFFEQKMYGIKVKEELTDIDGEVKNYFEVYNIEESFSPQKSILKNVKSEIIENVVILPGDLKVQNSEKCIDQKSNTISEKEEVAEIYSPEQLRIFNYNQCFTDRKKSIVKGVTDNETDFLGLPRITNIKTCDSAQTFNNTFVKKEEPEDVEFPKHFETIYREQCGSVDKIIIANVKGGITENETNLPRELRGQTVEKTVSEQKSNAVIIKDEQIEIERELTDDCISLLKQIIPTKDITYEKTSKAHICNVSCGSFCSKEKLTRNIQINTHPVKQFKCEICEKVFHCRRRFSVHMNVHTKEKEYKCKFCEKVYYHRNSLLYHLNLQTKEKKYKCEICDKIYFHSSQLHAHMQSHSNGIQRSCKFCGKLFSTGKNLYRHLNIHTKEKEYKCKFCNKIFHLKASLSKHLNLHTKEKEYKCEICDKVYFQSSQLNSHMQSHSNEDQRSCKFCGKLFAMGKNLKRHLNIHTKEKEYKCEECGKVLYRKDVMDKHMITHTEKNMYKCSICEKIFYLKSLLSKHVATHSE